ncbi:MAG: ribosome maturation factor RimM [Dehalococcoidia bacterium]
MPGQRPEAARRTHPEPRPGFVAVGWVRGPRGVRGELKVDPLTEFHERFAPGAALQASGATYVVRGCRPHRGTLLLELEGIESRAAAETLRNLLLEIPEESLARLPEGRYFRFQILGMEVFDRENRALGRIDEIIETGANDVYVVHDAEGELLIPAIDSVVQEIDVARQRMTVELIEGLERRPLRARPKSERSGRST